MEDLLCIFLVLYVFFLVTHRMSELNTRPASRQTEKTVQRRVTSGRKPPPPPIMQYPIPLTFMGHGEAPRAHWSQKGHHAAPAIPK